MEKYVAFLRGINVGGHHKVPMADLKTELESLSFENIITILNSGNVIFDAEPQAIETIEQNISTHLEQHFGFAIPTIIRTATTILVLNDSNPFKAFPLTKETRHYISFLKNDIQTPLECPWTSPDLSFKIIAAKDKNIISHLDLSITKTPKAMAHLEVLFSKEMTTRNWKTIARIVKKLDKKRL